MSVTRLPVKRNDLADLVKAIKEVVYGTGSGLSVTEAIGAIELAKLEILQEQQERNNNG